MEKINHPPQIALTARPLLLTVHETDVDDSPMLGPFFIITEFTTHQVALVDGIAHLAAAALLSPIFLDLPNNLGIDECGNRAVKVSGGEGVSPTAAVLR